MESLDVIKIEEIYEISDHDLEDDDNSEMEEEIVHQESDRGDEDDGDKLSPSSSSPLFYLRDFLKVATRNFRKSEAYLIYDARIYDPNHPGGPPIS